MRSGTKAATASPGRNQGLTERSLSEAENDGGGLVERGCQAGDCFGLPDRLTPNPSPFGERGADLVLG
jgi:hypothetical protein